MSLNTHEIEDDAPAEADVATALEELRILLREADKDFAPVFAQLCVGMLQSRIARMKSAIPLDVTDANSVFDTMIALTETVERMPRDLHAGWEQGLFALPPDMSPDDLVDGCRQASLALREASGLVARVLRPMTELPADSPLRTQLKGLAAPVKLAAAK